MAIKIVQFAHPGRQYILSPKEQKTSIKEWNTGDHRRKFLIAKGQYVNNKVLSSIQDLLFWGEWEPTSKILRTYIPVDPILAPTFQHSPFITLNKKGLVVKSSSPLKAGCSKGCLSCIVPGCVTAYHQFQNTDPFVFGDAFYYSCCKQEQFTSLRHLDVGSIILFGSTISSKHGGPYFALDKVFVVGEKRTYTAKTYKTDLAGFIPKYYDEIMGLSTWGSKTVFTCYKGATFNNPINGMYSFVPCKTIEVGGGGFQRARLTALDFKSISIPSLSKYKKNPYIITNNLNSAPKMIESNTAYNKQVWDIICQVIASQGYLQGMNFDYNIT